jgi:hypothetical protein
MLCAEQLRRRFGDDDVIQRESIGRPTIDLRWRERVGDRAHEALILRYRQMSRGMCYKSGDIVCQLLSRRGYRDQYADFTRQREVRKFIVTEIRPLKYA